VCNTAVTSSPSVRSRKRRDPISRPDKIAGEEEGGFDALALLAHLLTASGETSNRSAALYSTRTTLDTAAQVDSVRPLGRSLLALGNMPPWPARPQPWPSTVDEALALPASWHVSERFLRSLGDDPECVQLPLLLILAVRRRVELTPLDAPTVPSTELS